jgi:hypothetical protein
VIAACLCPAALAADRFRPYEQGPLQPADYQAVKPANHPHHASTHVGLKYHYEYETRTLGNVAEAWLTKMSLKSVVNQTKSWNERLADRKLLMHEQGHFDITEAMRRRAASYWARELRRVRARAGSTEEATRLLGKQVKREMQPFFDRLLLLQKQYDQDTNHGRSESQQRRWREQVDLLLRDPNASISALSPR